MVLPMVGKGGLEPPSLAALEPKSSSSANSDTSPHLTPALPQKNRVYVTLSIAKGLMMVETICALPSPSG